MGKIQKYYFKECEKYFSDSQNSRTQYPVKVILQTLTQYNKGHSAKEAKKLTGKKYRYSPPTSTIYSWVDKYEETLPFLKLRKKYDIDPDNLTTIRNGNEDGGERRLWSSPPRTTSSTNKFSPSPTTTFTASGASSSLSVGDARDKTQHPLETATRTTQIHKLDPQDYVRSDNEDEMDEILHVRGSSGARFTEFRRIERSLPRKMFLSGPRCSSTEIDYYPKIKERENLTIELTSLALNSQPKTSTKSPHETVEEFFLINDSTTVCKELPVFIKPSETYLDVHDPITGHIDLIQIRCDYLYILDYITRALPEVKGGTSSCASRI